MSKGGWTTKLQIFECDQISYVAIFPGSFINWVLPLIKVCVKKPFSEDKFRKCAHFTKYMKISCVRKFVGLQCSISTDQRSTPCTFFKIVRIFLPRLTDHSQLQLFLEGPVGTPPTGCGTHCPSKVAGCGKSKDLCCHC